MAAAAYPAAEHSAPHPKAATRDGRLRLKAVAAAWGLAVKVSSWTFDAEKPNARMRIAPPISLNLRAETLRAIRALARTLTGLWQAQPAARVQAHIKNPAVGGGRDPWSLGAGSNSVNAGGPSSTVLDDADFGREFLGTNLGDGSQPRRLRDVLKEPSRPCLLYTSDAADE